MSGHLFVVHGRLQDVECDAVLLPTDSRFSVRPYWQEEPLPKAPARPEDWAARGFAQHPTTASCWYVDVTRGGIADASAGTGAAVKAIEAICADEHDASRRALPLVALPMLGTGGGGSDRRAGAVAKELIERLTDVVETHSVDVAVVARDASHYAALQSVRRDLLLSSGTTPEDDLARQLGDRAAAGGLSLMIGAGVSMGAKLPGWDGLIKDVVQQWKAENEGKDRGEDEIDLETLKQLSVLDQAEVLDRVISEAAQRPTWLQESVRQTVQRVSRPGLGHLLLAALGCRQVVTTNYDLLYERAWSSQRPHGPAVRQLPYQRPGLGSRGCSSCTGTSITRRTSC